MAKKIIDQIKKLLKKNGTKYHQVDKQMLFLGFDISDEGVEGLDGITMSLIFPEGEDYFLAMSGGFVPSFDDDKKFLAGLALCNEFNQNKGLMKFILDEEHDRDVMVTFKSYINEDICEEVVSKGIGLMISAIVDTTPLFMRFHGK